MRTRRQDVPVLPPIRESVGNVNWRWRRLFRVIHIGTPDERTAKWHTMRLLRAALRNEHGQPKQ